jgi:hypothetical protein
VPELVEADAEQQTYGEGDDPEDRQEEPAQLSLR